MAFHNVYESLAEEHGWNTQDSCKTEWDDLPENNRKLMISTVYRLVSDGHIKIPTRIGKGSEILPLWEKPAFP